MEQLTFDILHADGRRESTTAQAPRIVVGSGAHCDVRLAPDQAAFEHVAIEDHPAGPLMRSLATSPAVVLDGAPLTTHALGAVTTFRIGATQIEIKRAVLGVEAQSSSLGPAMIAKLAVVALLAVGIFAVSHMNKEQPVAAPPKMPELFAKAVTECPRTDPAEARVLGDDNRALGGGARERSPFDPREARSAVRSYELAAVCYRRANALEAAEESASNAKRMREETTLDFRARRVRLERVLLVGDYEVAAQDVAVLRALTEGQPGEYTRWLASVTQDIKNQKAEKSQ
ncbi:MAG: hypothetical protein JWP87_4178 [Labilithrix sp.]|nr:hypothetical protein [Labilithrix sp.]